MAQGSLTSDGVDVEFIRTTTFEVDDGIRVPSNPTTGAGFTAAEGKLIGARNRTGGDGRLLVHSGCGSGRADSTGSRSNRSPTRARGRPTTNAIADTRVGRRG